MTNHYIDFKNADVVLAMGSNPAENHPVCMKWVMEARKKGGKLVSVDPRFTRTSAVSDVYAPLRSGTDIAFLGGMIKYILDNKLYFEDYVKLYTNATFLIDPAFKMPGELDGLFSGYDEAGRKYDKKSWSYQRNEDGTVKQDMSMGDPNCVFQLLKKHYGRYTTDLVTEITGTPKDKLLPVYQTYAATGQRDKAGTILYAMGWTQHTVGTQNIRTMSIIQLLLGNMGIMGGGVNALRGESNVQGSTDMALLFHILPGYLKIPNSSLQTFDEYNAKWTPKYTDPKSANWWQNYPKYSTSLMKEFFGAKGTKENGFGYEWLPKVDDGKNHSWLAIFDEMFNGSIKGFFSWGQNPACSGANANKVRESLKKLDWLVTVNVFDSETASFWKGPGMNPADIQTEVFSLPACGSYEKQGSIANSGRWVQWRYKACEPVGESLPDGDIISELYFAIKHLYQKEGGAYPTPIMNLAWNYGPKKSDGSLVVFDPDLVARELNGYFLEDKEINGVVYKKGTLVPGFALLQSDGSTSCGNWIYCNSYNEQKGNLCKRRDTSDPHGLGLYANWSWVWPVNRRILYNRASVDPSGKPWNPNKPIIFWNGSGWVGDVPDGPWPPMDTAAGKYPFIMTTEGFGKIYGPGLAEGPFPEHYEALECPIDKNLMSGQRINPTVKLWYKDEKSNQMDVFHTCDPRFPFVCTTYRTSEHWQTGILTRNLPWLLEMQPQNFVEMSTELAKLLNIKNGEKVMVSSARGQVGAIAMVTERFKPFTIAGTTVHQVGMPYNFGWTTKDSFDSANLLTPTVGDANTMIPESKAFLVNIKKA
ncbi:MAG: formate dehydrogenase-N subunit alpha [Desulfobulbaceae bacterium A2]|nr:MAG: formate dehydrogenase-N subunit alpha [Desulfobulbaceae bacterium A2]